MMVTPLAFNSRMRIPHALAQFHVHAGGGLVEEQDLRLVSERLGDHDAPLHAAGERYDAAVPAVQQRQILQHLGDVRRIWRKPEKPPAERDGIPDVFKRVGGKLLRHEPNHRPGRAVILINVVAIDRDRAAARVHGAADDADERGLARAVGAEQGENLAGHDIQAHAFQRLKPGSVFLCEVRDGDDRIHGAV